MRLIEYLEATGETPAAFAARSGVPKTTIRRLCERADLGCHISTAHLIVTASHDRPAPRGGVVTFEDLIPSEAAAS